MILKNLLSIFVISIILLEQGCDENIIQQKASNNLFLTELSPEHSPQKEKVNPDSLIIHIPGEKGIKQPEIILSRKPIAVEIISPDEVLPGISFLNQSVSEKLAGDLPIKSKKPEIIKINPSINKDQNSIQFEAPIVTILPQSINLDLSSLSSFEKIANENGLVSYQHNDSIFPPVSILASRPRQIKALPMKQKEDALFNILFLDADQELPNSFIRAITKDKDGILWFGTHTGGLVSYNGQFFNHYTTKTGLSSDMILSLLIDKKDNLWIGTQGGGVNRFDGRTITHFTKKQGLPSNIVLDIIEDSKGNIWFATTMGVCYFNGETITTFNTKQGLASNTVTSLCEDNLGNIWFGTNGGGITKYDGNNLTTYDLKDGLASNIILSIKMDHLGNIWFGTNGGGVSKFDGQAFTNYTSAQGLGNDIILSITEDSDNNMWFGTFGSGLTCFNGESFSYYTTKEGLSDDYVRTLFKDDNGSLLIGTDGDGVCFVNLHSFTHYTKEHGLSDNLVLSILQDKNDKLWLGTFEGGVIILNESKKPGQKSTFTHITTKQGLVNNIVLSILQDNNGDFWFGTYGGGVSKLDGKSLSSGELKFTNYTIDQGLINNIVRSIIQDNKGNIWFGTETGATKFDGNSFTTLTKESGLGSSKILNIFQDKDGALWFGTMDGGVTRLKNDSVTKYTINQGLRNNTVWSITQDHNGDMWFGTNGGGLTCFNGYSFRNFNTENGLCNDYVFSLITDHNNSIWAGTTRGLAQIKLPDNSLSGDDSFSNDKYTIFNYGKTDGLKDIDFYTNAVFHDNMDRLWWGTGKALSFLDLNDYNKPEHNPTVQISGIIINNKTINFNELLIFDNNKSQSRIHFSDVSPFSNNPIDLSLPHSFNHLTFQFSATYWCAPDQIKYQYKLQGLDNKWSPLTKDNIADYRNISPGKYSFLVQAMGKPGSWGIITEYPFVIRQPWWLTWWAIILYIITIILVIWLIVKWRVNIVLKQKNILENLIFDRTKELDDALSLAEQAAIAKNQFIATMSHEIRTPLNAIMGFTHLAISTNLNPKQEDYIQKINRSAITLLSLINNILDLSKIEAGKMQLEKVNFDLEIVMNSIIILNAQNTRDKKLEFIININPDVPRFLIGDPLRIGQVITNLCNNAIKFTSSGTVTINVDIDKIINNDEIYLKIAVIDTGIGIRKEQIPTLFDEFEQADSSITRKYGGTGLGLTISKSLIEMMNGNIWLKSEPNKGTTFSFNCKVGVQPDNVSLSSLIPDELKELNIMVCDDHPLAMQSLVTILKSFSLNVDGVSSLEEASKHLEENSCDLLLIDLQFKDNNNIDIKNLIHKNKDLPPIKTILIDNSELNEKSPKMNIDGDVEYLNKPYLPSIVMDKLLSVFGMKETLFHEQNKNGDYLNYFKKTLAGQHIMLAEDNEMNQQVMTELLEKIGVKVDLAGNGEIALKMAQETDYDLILMDLHMPVMDGYNATMEIRKHNHNVPIIAITADAVNTIITKCNEVGIVDIITKPIDPDLLYNKLLKWETKDNETNKPSVEFNNNLTDIVIRDLDIQSGIYRFGGNEKLYIKMLKKFIFANKQTCLILKELIKDREFDQAHLITHTLKGESGNIGAKKVYNLTQAVEQTILDKNVSGFNKKVILLESSIKDIILDTQKYFQETTNETEKDQRSIKELIIELIEFLELKNPKAFDLLDELTLAGVKKSELDKITKAINNNDLKKAFLLLKKLSDKY